ncbi:MAG: hypothetical protein ACRDNW_26600 [Trebonia sp.]
MSPSSFMSRWKVAAQIPWYIGSGTGTPKFRHVCVLARMANW